MRNSPITTSPRRLLIACAALASIGFASVIQADTLEKIKDSNSVRIGYANETPFAYTALVAVSPASRRKSCARSSSAWRSAPSNRCSPNGAR